MTLELELDIAIIRIDELIAQNEIELAKNELEELLFDAPDFGKVHGYLGWIYANFYNNKERAELHFLYSIKFDPKFVGAYINYALLLLKSNRVGEAKEILNGGLMQNEIDKSLIYEVYADVHEMEGKINKAFSMLKSALKLSNDPFQSEHLISNIKRLRRKRWALFLF
jgi:tetratricopeptide (TPR) repeat protein